MIPKLSIIVPIYNSEKYLSKCIESLINQTIKDIEIILVNDGSNDNSSIICEKYRRKDDRVRIINQENKGVSVARNSGMKLAIGKYIGFVDADDFLDKDALEYLYNLAENNKCDIACYKMKIYKDGTLTGPIMDVENIKVYEDSIIENQIKYGKFLHGVCNKIYIKDLFDDNIEFCSDIKYSEDALFNICIMSKAKRLVYSNIPKYNYYINSNSTVIQVNENRTDILKAQVKMFNILKDKYDNYSKYIVNDFITSSVSIIIDMARQNISNKNLILKLKDIINENSYIVNNKKTVSLKQLIMFKIISMQPIVIWYVYKLRFKLLTLKRTR